MSMPPCPNMFNTEQQSLCTPTVNPRISFSNDFADIQQPTKHENTYREAPVSSEFEFSVKNYSMMSADELFFKGMMLPVKNSCTNQQRKMTLRDELSVDDDDVFPRIPKNGSRWIERLGLKKGLSLSSTNKKCDKSDGVLETVVEEKMPEPVFVHEEAFVSKKTQIQME
ncbi:hypothetical protein F2P56_029173 [Juglans regia]|uniref:Uncharacterized protein n=2 Tax=Juglans regia TaxID=51240 RepID=A0A833U9N0_JUGRE|nr:uncharacterized protein LOC109002328 isoform X2 [Juglans regia]KAF5448664.1 hypothetical protein F2P56_029173 [Juglans regia]